jgi:hypothetical protein
LLQEVETIRILITGSRYLEDSMVVSRAIAVAMEELSSSDDKDIVIVHGAAPGADTLAGDFVSQAKNFMRGHGVTVREERHPVSPEDWEKIGKKAGPLRNQKMVDLGADICLAFPAKNSRGTLDCMMRARKAGIPVKVYNV